MTSRLSGGLQLDRSNVFVSLQDSLAQKLIAVVCETTFLGRVVDSQLNLYVITIFNSDVAIYTIRIMQHSLYRRPHFALHPVRPSVCLSVCTTAVSTRKQKAVEHKITG